MAGTVTIVVEGYPFDGATGLVVEERTSYGWVEVLSTASIGSFPGYTTTYEVTGTGPGDFRYRWELGTKSSSWLKPLAVTEPPVTATDEITERIKQAVIAKAIRIMAMGAAPLGTHGEMTEFGSMRVMPDYQISELLTGLLRVNWDIDMTTLVDVADITNTEGYESIPAADQEEAQRAIDSAVSWVAEYILGAVPV